MGRCATYAVELALSLSKLLRIINFIKPLEVGENLRVVGDCDS